MDDFLGIRFVHENLTSSTEQELSIQVKTDAIDSITQLYVTPTMIKNFRQALIDSLSPSGECTSSIGVFGLKVAGGAVTVQVTRAISGELNVKVASESRRLAWGGIDACESAIQYFPTNRRCLDRFLEELNDMAMLRTNTATLTLA